MVIENQIPKTETVYELKNEVPSYEEFISNYEVDEKIIDSYQSEFRNYGSLGEVKGCGPCTSSNCIHSRSELQEQLKEVQRELEKTKRNYINVKIYLTNKWYFTHKDYRILDVGGEWNRKSSLSASRYKWQTDVLRITSIDQLKNLCKGLFSRQEEFGRHVESAWDSIDDSYVPSDTNERPIRVMHLGITKSGGTIDEYKVKDKVKELYQKWERGENIDGSYTINCQAFGFYCTVEYR